MQKLKLSFSFLLVAGMFTLAFLGCQKSAQDPSVTSNAKPTAPKTKMDVPTVTCAGSTRYSIDLEVCAGATGAPAGFSVQWMTAAAYAANGDAWYLSEDTRLCKASFSGNANNSRYLLAPNACVTVTIGDLLYDQGTSTNCGDELFCSTAYVFRVFAHANSSLQRSDFSNNRNCSTANCGNPVTVCSYSQGYWFNAGQGNSQHSWNGNTLTLGTCTYTEAEARAIRAFIRANGGEFGSVKQAFLQAGAIKISFAVSGAPIPPEVQDNLDIIDAFFATLSCLTSSSIPTANNQAVTDAAAALSQWIHDNHCL